MTSKIATYNHGVSWKEAFGTTQGYNVIGTSDLAFPHRLIDIRAVAHTD